MAAADAAQHGGPGHLVRAYGRGDLDGVLALCAAQGWRTYVEDPDRAHRAFSAPGVVAVVAVAPTSHGAEVVGFASLQTDGVIQAHLSLLVVAERHRRSGVAGALVAAAAASTGAARIDLIADDAAGFYRSLPHTEHAGFRIYPTVT